MRPSNAAPRLYSGLALAMLAPLLAHATWRPLAVALGGPLDGRSLAVSVAAVAVSAMASGFTGRALGFPLVLAAVAGAVVAGGPGTVSLLGVALTTLVAAPRMAAAIAEVGAHRQGPPSRLLSGAWVAMSLACLAAAVDLATYLGDPLAAGFGIAQGTELYRHFCATAYLHAAELVSAGVPDVYDTSLVPPLDDGILPATAAHMAPFVLDRYGYPPQFLLLPLASKALVPDFAAWRALWTCANALLFARVLWTLGFWVGPRSGRVLRYLGPALWMLGGVVYQSGNVQLSVFGLGLLALIAAHEGRERTGGLLLAAVTLAKIAPGLVGVLLLVRGRWHAVLWTVAWAVALTLATLAVTGPDVFIAFVDLHLPAVSSGRAFDFLDDSPLRVFENLSPFGLPFKLAALGVAWDPWVWGPRFARVYTILAFGMAVVAGRRVLDRRGQAAVWMLVLTVAALRSPMAPGYLLAGAVAGLALVGAEVHTVRGFVLGAVLFGAMMMTTPFAPPSLWTALAGQAVLHATIVWLLLRDWPVLDTEHPPRPLGAMVRLPTTERTSHPLESP